MPHQFGAKLRYIRRLHKLTQGELARHLFLASYTYITRLEADQRTPSLVFVVRLAMLFGQSTDYFLRDTISLEEVQPSIVELLSVENMPMQLFGTKLRELRLQKGWSQTELTHQLSLKHPGYINNLEAGRRAPSLDLVVQMADLFGVTTDYLLRDTIPIASLAEAPQGRTPKTSTPDQQ